MKAADFLLEEFSSCCRFAEPAWPSLSPQEGDAALAELRGQLEAERRSHATEVETLSTQVCRSGWRSVHGKP